MTEQEKEILALLAHIADDYVALKRINKIIWKMLDNLEE